MKRSHTTTLASNGDTVNRWSDCCEHCAYQWHMVSHTEPGQPAGAQAIERLMDEHKQFHHVVEGDSDTCRSICDCDAPNLSPTDDPTVFRVDSPRTFWLLSLGARIEVNGEERRVVMKQTDGHLIGLE